MFGAYIKFIKELDKRVKVGLAGTGIYTFCQWLSSQYNALYAESLGATGVDIGLLNGISSAVKLVSAIPIGSAVEKYSVKKVMLLGLIVEVVAAAIFAAAGFWWMLIPAFILHARLISLLPLTDIIFVTVTEPQKRSTVMSLSRVLWGILNIFAPLTAAVVVAYYGGINAQGIRPLYYLSFFIYGFVFIFVAKELGNITTGREQDKSRSKRLSAFHGYRELLGERSVKRWIVLRTAREFAAAFSMSFIPLWMVNVKGATPYIIGSVSILSIILALILNIPVGRLADKIGRKKAYFMFAPFNWLGVLLLIAASRPEYLPIVGILGGVGGGVIGGGIGGASFTPFITMWWEQVPAEKRGKWLGIEGVLTSAATIPAAIIAGILWDQGLMIPVLLVPVLLEALVVIPILSTVPDTLRSRQ